MLACSTGIEDSCRFPHGELQRVELWSRCKFSQVLIDKKFDFNTLLLSNGSDMGLQNKSVYSKTFSWLCLNSFLSYNAPFFGVCVMESTDVFCWNTHTHNNSSYFQLSFWSIRVCEYSSKSCICVSLAQARDIPTSSKGNFKQQNLQNTKAGVRYLRNSCHILWQAGQSAQFNYSTCSVEKYLLAAGESCVNRLWLHQTQFLVDDQFM